MRADTRIAAGVAAGYVLGRRHKLRTAVMPAGAGLTGRFPGTGGSLSGRADERSGGDPDGRRGTEDTRRRPHPVPPTRSHGEEHPS